jgi:polysaccharide biosynthesis/export protein
MAPNSTIQRYTVQKAAVLQTNHPIVPTESFQQSKTTLFISFTETKRKRSLARSRHQSCSRDAGETMSRNYGLMRRAGGGSEIDRIGIPTGPVLRGESHGNGHPNGTNLKIKLAREELFKLVQQVFLTPPKRLRAIGSVDYPRFQNMRFSAFAVAVLLATSGMLSAQTSVSSSVNPAQPRVSDVSTSRQPALSERAPRYHIRESDSLELQFAFSPEFNQTVEVQPDGYITLKSAGSIVAQGLTIPELTKAIEHAYAGILHDPVVTIELKDFDKPFFVVSGQVGKPGKYDLRSDLTVTEGVAIAGGFTEKSKHSQVVLFRPETNDLTEVRVIDVKKLLRTHNLQEDVHLRPGDMIFVPQNQISKISRYLPTSTLGLYAYPGIF